MAENTKIEWAHHTFNPWVGCTKVSPACDHCYAEGWAKRSGQVQWGGERRRTSVHNWKQPLKWNAEADRTGVRFRVFCASLADVFDNQVPKEWRYDLFNLILSTPHLDWLLLTKRIGNAKKMIEETLPDVMKELPDTHPLSWPWPNVWIGATICNQEEADRDIPKLLSTPATKRFLSIEPMLGKIEISRLLHPVGIHCLPICSDTHYVNPVDVQNFKYDEETVPICPLCGKFAMWIGYDSGIDWVIVGGESGPGARPMHPDWASGLRDQCIKAQVPYLFKQWGEWAPRGPESLGYPVIENVPEIMLGENGYRLCAEDRSYVRMHRAGKKKAGRLLEGKAWDEVPV